MFELFHHAPPRAQVRSSELVAPGGIVLDVRTREEFASGHVEGAVNIPVQELDARIGEVGALGREVVVYCRSGGRSAAAAQILREAGFAVRDIGPMPRRH
jgi:phage shock protein E